MTAAPRNRVLASREVMIPTRDGVQLAANLLLPETDGPVPAVFQFFPYQKDGRVGRTHEPYQRYFAERGYASLLVDFRGTGNSTGHDAGPLAPEERQDGHDAVEWLAAQPWCSGTVGIWGISYGGITALSIASTRPPHLGAIIPIHATYDNYAWLFRPNGCQGLLLPDLGWGTQMTGLGLVPPLIATDEADWQAKWHERLERNEPWLLPWHGAPPDPDYWARRIIPIEQIEVPTFGICAWHDSYVEPMLEIHDRLRVPKRILIGPWKHALPDTAPDHPIGGAHEMTRWWDRWLSGIDDGADGIEAEPPITFFVMGDDAWRRAPSWPPPETTVERRFLADGGRLSPSPDGAPGSDAYATDSRVGAASIGTNNQPVSLPVPEDQSVDDHLSLAYTSEPLETETEITGAPSVRLWVSATVAAPQLAAKLCIVGPSGASRVIGRGWLNVARPDPYGPRRPLSAGEVREVEIRLRPTSIVARRGDRLRLCIAGSDFPHLWPPTQAGTLTVHRGPDRPARVDIPVVPRHPPDPAVARLEPADPALVPHPPIVASESYEVRRRLSSRELRYVSDVVNQTRVDAGTTITMEHHAVATTDADAPERSRLETDTTFTLRSRSRTVTTRVEYHVTRHVAHVTTTVDLDGRRIHERRRRKDTPDPD